jgi:hypothetical protein
LHESITVRSREHLDGVEGELSALGPGLDFVEFLLILSGGFACAALVGKTFISSATAVFCVGEDTHPG